MNNVDVKVGSSYLSVNKRIITIDKKLNDDHPSALEGYPFVGRFQGAINSEYFTQSGRVWVRQHTSGDLIKPVMTEEEFVDFFCDRPGATIEQLISGVKSREERLFIRHAMQDKLLTQKRISVIRFTTYAPSLNTTFLIFATEHGRIEIIDNKPVDFAGHQINHVHDPMGLWDQRMKEAQD